MKSHKYRKLSLAVLLTAAVVAVQPGQAAYPDSETVERSISVRFADLNLDNDDGVAALYRRLRLAAESVCGPQSLRAAGALMTLRANRQCYDQTLDRAVAEIGHAALEDLHGA